jgi:hypothetical protein
MYAHSQKTQSEAVMTVFLLIIWVYWQVGKTGIERVSDH